MKPEEQARRKIDELLEAAGWSVQDPTFNGRRGGCGRLTRKGVLPCIMIYCCHR
jgi:hypothetical protein